MRLAMADVKKSVVRRHGEAYLVPFLLRRGDLDAQIAALIALHEDWLGRERATFPEDRPAELMGDYRLARCLVTLLGDYYVWSPPPWPGPASDAEASALAAAAIATPGQLRLALYDAVNASNGGYLSAAEREPFLNTFAARLSLARPTLDALLALDAPEHALLTRAAPQPPAPAALSVLYNQRAVEAILSASTSVEWLLAPDLAAARGTSLGTILKRICFLARCLGVYYDVAFADDETGPVDGTLPRVAETTAHYRPLPDSPSDVDATKLPLCLTLYGAQEAFGPPNQYGDRLARLCRLILADNLVPSLRAGASRARRRALASAPGSPFPQRDPPTASALQGEAQILLRGSRFRFTLDDRLLALLGPAAPDSVGAPADPGVAPDLSTIQFDSDLERALHDEFAALERADATHGWRMEREPEPILCADVILIPDFALTRGSRRVYVEVAGFWSPAYRERKRRKLAALAGHVDLIVAAPDAARPEFEGLQSAFPWLWFRHHVSAQALVNLLHTHFDDFAARRTALPLDAILDEVARRGLLPWAECAASLHVYTRSELARVMDDLADAAARANSDPPVLVDAVGLATPAWLSHVGDAIGSWLRASGDAGLPLAELAARLGDVIPSLAGHAGASAAEALANATGHAVVRASLFEPRVMAAAPAPAGSAGSEPATPSPRPAQPRRHNRRKHGEGASPLPMPWQLFPQDNP
jgi:predicted nuclease of restriction endonuclease-like RecB superfamily